jgi:hypothetical protein
MLRRKKPSKVNFGLGRFGKINLRVEEESEEVSNSGCLSEKV